MNEKELGEILKDLYNKAPKGYQVANIHFFGVKYASIIQRNHLNVKNIVAFSD